MPEPKGRLVVPAGFRASGLLRALALDDNDYLKVAIAAYVAGTLVEVAGKDAGAVVRELLVSTTGRMLVDPGGADKLFAYDSPWANTVANTSLAAGENILYSSAVAAGKVAIITNWTIRYDGTASGVILAPGIYDGSGVNTIYGISPPVSGQSYDRQGWWVLPAGYKAALAIYGATLNDDAYLVTAGFQMDAS